MNSEDLEILLDKELENMILLEAIENKIDDELKENETLNKDKKNVSKKRKRKKITSKKIKESLKIRTVILLLLTLIVNTYAWFIYISTVSTQINVHVKSWKIDFTDIDSDYVELDVEEIYPGMEEVEQSITATNNGEMTAKLTYTIDSIEVFGEEKVPVGHPIEATEFEELMKEYPFEIEINILLNDAPYTLGDPIEKDGKIEIKFKVNWDYVLEEGTDIEIEQRDEDDTKLGIGAYDFYKAHPEDDKAIKIKVHIKTEQY